MRFSHALPNDRDAGRGYWGVNRTALGSPERRSGGFLPEFAGSGAGGDRGHRADSLIRVLARGTGSRTVDRGRRKVARAPKKAPPATARELESFTEVQTEALSSSVFLDRRAVADQRIRRRRTHAAPSPPPKSPHSRRRHVDRHNARNRLEAPRHRNPAATPAVAGLAQKTNSLEFHEVARIRSVV